jgi:hypothetical protein
MELMDNGHGNFGDFQNATQKALGQKKFKYLIVEKSGGDPARLGGSFSFVIQGTDNPKEICDRRYLKKDVTVIHADSGHGISIREFALQYVNSLSAVERVALVNEALVDHLLK